MTHDKLTREPDGEWFAEDDRERAEILEDRDAYEVVNVFWVPKEARWDALLALGSQPDLGVRLDAALALIERENVALKDVLPKVSSSPRSCATSATATSSSASMPKSSLSMTFSPAAARNG